jgi:dihydrofolate synthase / folylpolyglutamate synthase
MPALIETYAAAIEFLYNRVNYERVQVEAYSTSDFKLERMRVLLSLIGSPHERLPAVHVAGTKGKGSTCAMIASVLTAAGHRTGLYISPHISAFEERMTVDGVRPSPGEIVGLVNRLLPVIAHMDGLPGQMQPTYFELATAIGWLYFEDRRAEFVVLEVGLGGRLDSTNVCRPWVTVITNVSRDHTHILGSTVRQIAWEKAGIIKSGIPVVSGVSHVDAIEIVERACRERNAPLRLLGREIHVTDQQRHQAESAVEDKIASIDVRTSHSEWRGVPVPLRGAHQAANAALALAAIDELRQHGISISEADVRAGMAVVVWPGRVEVVSRRPTIVIDAAHNWESVRALVATLREEFRPRRRLLIFAATRDKDVAGLLRLLLPVFDTIIFTRYVDNPRGVPAQELQSFVRSVSNREVHLAEDPSSAWHLAQRWAGLDDLIVVTGSFFLVAELRDLILRESGSHKTKYP